MVRRTTQSVSVHNDKTPSAATATRRLPVTTVISSTLKLILASITEVMAEYLNRLVTGKCRGHSPISSNRSNTLSSILSRAVIRTNPKQIPKFLHHSHFRAQGQCIAKI